MYEVLFTLCVCFFLLCDFKIIKPANTVFIILLLFTSITAITSIYSTAFPSDGYYNSGIVYRFSEITTTVTKIIYLLFTSVSFYMLSQFSFSSSDKYYRYWMYGAGICLIYTYYLFISSIFGLEPILLPGSTDVQKLNFGGISFIRSGTFEEGNFLALYLLLSTVLAVYNSNYKLAGIFSITILITFSSINIAALLLFYLLVTKKKLRRLTLLKKMRVVGVVTIIVLAVLTVLFFTSYLEEVFYAKFASPLGSAADRLDQSIAGFRMFINNLFIGVGHGNYGYYYKHYQYTDIFESFHGSKMIANNVYIELLAETGMVGLLLFLSIFGFLLYKFNKETDEKFCILKYGTCCILIVFVAYPSYMVIFIWAFLAYATAEYSLLQTRKVLKFV